MAMRPMQLEVEHILIRRWASYVSMPLFAVSQDGELLYYNEPAGAILGRPFDAVGPLSVGELNAAFATTDEDGRPLDAGTLPIHVALAEGRPCHKRIRIRGLDGVRRLIEVTAFPLRGQGGKSLGALAVFWAIDD